MTKKPVSARKKNHAGLFVKGFDPRRNMAGRPKRGETIAERIRAAMEERIRPDGYTKLDALIDEAMARAKAGDYQMLKELWARGYGAIPDKVEVTSQDAPDLSKLTDDEITTLRALMEKAKRD